MSSERNTMKAAWFNRNMILAAFAAAMSMLAAPEEKPRVRRGEGNRPFAQAGGEGTLHAKGARAMILCNLLNHAVYTEQNT